MAPCTFVDKPSNALITRPMNDLAPGVYRLVVNLQGNTDNGTAGQPRGTLPWPICTGVGRVAWSAGEASPTWLKGLMNAFADGLNYYLARHPEVKPRVIKRFEPWMALSLTEGSIGGEAGQSVERLAQAIGQRHAHHAVSRSGE
jgi:hypothetical protein